MMQSDNQPARKENSSSVKSVLGLFKHHLFIWGFIIVMILIGLMIGIELKFEVKDILLEGIEKGVLLLYSGRNILRLLPPLVITEDHITKTLEILDELLTNEEKRRNG